MMLYILHIPTVRVHELSAGADLHVIIPRDDCCFVYNLVVSLKSHPNQYGLCQINAATLCKQAVIVTVQLFLHCFIQVKKNENHTDNTLTVSVSDILHGSKIK